MSGLALRSATLADLDAIIAMESTGFAAHHQESPDVYARRIEAFPEGSLIAERDACIAGCFFSEVWQLTGSVPDESHFQLGHDIRARHRPRQGRTLYVSSMTLAPAFRGRQLGQPFFAACLDRVTRSLCGLEEIVLLVNESGRGARQIYVATGFEEISRLPGFFGPTEPNAEDGIVMRRPISRS